MDRLIVDFIVRGSLIAGTALCPAMLLAQAAPAPKLEFDAATIRPAAPLTGRGSPRGGPGTSDPERMNFQYLSLKNLLLVAYGLPATQIFGPSWIDSDRYDITAKVPSGATKEQANLMLQNLLADRFKLVVHRETREMQAYELTVGKNGSKLKPYVEDPNAPKLEPGKLNLDKDGKPMVPPGGFLFSMGGATRRVAASKATIGGMPGLALTLGNELGRPVVDRTGLTGFYDFVLEYRPVASPAGGLAPSPAESGQDAPDLITAVAEQLGLRLESKKDPVEVLVVDSGEKTPTEN